MTHLKRAHAQIIQRTQYAIVTPALTEVCELALALASKLDAIEAECNPSSPPSWEEQAKRLECKWAYDRIRTILEPEE